MQFTCALAVCVLFASTIAMTGCATGGSRPTHPSPLRVTGLVSVMRWSAGAPNVNVGYQVQNGTSKWFASRITVDPNLGVGERLIYVGLGPQVTPNGLPVNDGGTLCAWVQAVHGAEGPWTLHELTLDEEFDDGLSPCLSPAE